MCTRHGGCIRLCVCPDSTPDWTTARPPCQVDHRAECVLVPIYGVLVPFHILTIKNASNNAVGQGPHAGAALGQPAPCFRMLFGTWPLQATQPSAHRMPTSHRRTASTPTSASTLTTAAPTSPASSSPAPSLSRSCPSARQTRGTPPRWAGRLCQGPGAGGWWGVGRERGRGSAVWVAGGWEGWDGPPSMLLRAGCGRQAPSCITCRVPHAAPYGTSEPGMNRPHPRLEPQTSPPFSQTTVSPTHLCAHTHTLTGGARDQGAAQRGGSA